MSIKSCKFATSKQTKKQQIMKEINRYELPDDDAKVIGYYQSDYGIIVPITARGANTLFKMLFHIAFVWVTSMVCIFFIIIPVLCWVFEGDEGLRDLFVVYKSFWGLVCYIAGWIWKGFVWIYEYILRHHQ